MENGEKYLRELRDDIAERGTELTPNEMMEMMRLLIRSAARGDDGKELIEFLRKRNKESEQT